MIPHGEPNIFYDIYKNHKFLILRNKSLGVLCGYVAVKPPYGDYNSAPSKLLNCHGGLTFSNVFDSNYLIEPYKIKEKNKFKKFVDNTFWVGFDCGHAGDKIPNINLFPFDSSGVYRHIDYVICECMNLIDQILSLKVYHYYYDFGWENSEKYVEWFYNNKKYLKSSILSDDNYIATDSKKEYMLIKLSLD